MAFYGVRFSACYQAFLLRLLKINFLCKLMLDLLMEPLKYQHQGICDFIFLYFLFHCPQALIVLKLQIS